MNLSRKLAALDALVPPPPARLVIPITKTICEEYDSGHIWVTNAVFRPEGGYGSDTKCMRCGKRPNE